MPKKLSKKEMEEIRKEREELFAQAEVFLAEEDYEILPDLFFQIAEISKKLGEDAIAEDFIKRSEDIRALILSTDAPLEPEILDVGPSSPNFPPAAPPKAPPSALPSAPPSAAPSYPPISPSAAPPAALPTGPRTSPSATPPAASTSSTSADPITSKLQKLRNLVQGLSIPKTRPLAPVQSTTAPPTLPTVPNPAIQPAINPITPPTTPPQFSPTLPQIPPPEDISSGIDSLIAQRRSSQGTALESGIVPTIVRDEEEVIREILNEKLPYMPDRDKDKAIEKILTYPPGVQRDAWLKVFLIKNKRYTKKIL